MTKLIEMNKNDLELTITEAFEFGLIQGQIEAIRDIMRVGDSSDSLTRYIRARLSYLEAKLTEVSNG